MYTKQETSKQKQAFWTAFGRYMKPILSADGEPLSWINYKTGNKQISFKMDVDTRHASISILLSDHPDRPQTYLRLLQLKPIFEETLGEQDWTWQPNATDEHGKPISIIHKQLPGVNIFNTEDWPAIISFLKPRIIALDSFWSLVRYQFQDL